MKLCFMKRRNNCFFFLKLFIDYNQFDYFMSLILSVCLLPVCACVCMDGFSSSAIHSTTTAKKSHGGFFASIMGKQIEIWLLLIILKINFFFSDESKFSEAVQSLLTWIEQGEVNHHSTNNFYSMIQSAISHVCHLVNEKATHEKDMEEAKEKFKQAFSRILIQCEWKSEFC